MKKVALIGAGRHAMVVAEKIFDIPGLELYGFIDKHTVSLSDFIAEKGYKILGDEDVLLELDKNVYVHICLGGGLLEARRRISREIGRLGLNSISIVHPSAYIAPSASLGEGVTVLVGAAINTNATIGNHCCINTKAIVEHDCIVGDNVFLQPGSILAGNVTVGEDTVVGVGASVRDKIRIGKNCVIGGGAFVCENIPDNSIAYGVPAKVVGKRK